MSDSRGGGPGVRDGRDALLGAALAAVALGLYVWLVGVGDVVAALGRVSSRRMVTLALAGFGPVVLWGLSFRIVLAAVGVTSPTWKAVVLFLASVFMNSVTPFGQVGGDPPSGLLIARETGTRFETALAAIAGVNALNRVAVVLLGAVGGTWYTARVAASETLRNAIVLAVVLATLGVAVAAVAWLRRDALADPVGGAIATLLAVVCERLPVVAPTREAVVGRVRGFVAAIERVGSRPGLLAAVFVLGAAGQLVVAAVLWFVLAALGVDASLSVVLLVVPAARLAGVTPLPGGSVGAEALLGGLLVAGTGVALPVATAAALLYRAVTFWLPTVAGGLATVALLVRSRADKAGCR